MEEIKEFRKSLQNRVIRREETEQKFGIEIKHLTFITEPESNYITINFELHARNGYSIPKDINIHFAFYDEEENIFLKDEISIDKDVLAGFSIENCCWDLNTYAKAIAKIVVYVSSGYE